MKTGRLKKYAVVFALLFLVFSAIEVSAAIKDSKKLSSELLRLHIKANSDSEEDQALKIKVRDRIIKDCSYLFESCKNADEAYETALENSGIIVETAQKEIKANGYDYDVDIEIKDTYFPTRIYDDNIMLPAGTYKAVNIYIGNGKGNNWWCVMFPPLCLSGSISEKSKAENEKKFRELLSDGSFELASPKTQKAKVKFKIVELINEIIHIFD